jgi:2-polyprenyl-3-methyl-5-hydroxy-6-metoxy-1,4-benzoquinol methylase
MEAIDLQEIASGLQLSGPGLWTSHSQSEISYPEEGNRWCLLLEENSFWFRHRSQAILALLQRCPPPGTFFDVGGGNGLVSLAAQQAGWQTVLLEPGPQGVQNARRRGVAITIQSTLEDAGFKPGCLPAVGMFDVLEHIQDDEGFLRQVSELLAPGGRLYLTTPAYQALWSTEDQFAGHYRRYTLAALRKKLAAVGLQVEFASYIFLFLPLPVLLLRALPSRLGLRRSVNLEQEVKEHGSPGGATGRILDGLLRAELKRLQDGRRLPFGGSCLVAARKPA